MMKRLLLYLIAIVPIFSISQNHFVTTWQTTTPNESITIPTIGTGYNYDIDWENDGTFDDLGVTGNITHNYPNSGVHTIAIRGDFPRIYFNNGGSKNQILSIEQWGDIAWTSFNRAFFGCANLVINASDAPDLSNVNDLSSMFRSCTSFNQSIDHWDVSNITSIAAMFFDSTYNQPLNSWDVSNVTSMSNTFSGASFFNQPLNNWDVSNVIDMTYMFNACSAFNQPLDNWDVGNVTSMFGTFYFAIAFNQPLNSWDVSSVTNMWNSFGSASSFNQPLNNWDVSSVTNMRGMFEAAQSFNQPIDSWNVGNVTDMAFMFINAQSFNQPLNNWDVSSVTNMNRMFTDAISFNRRLGGWIVSNVTDMSRMFDGATSFNQPLTTWVVNNVTDMSSMFSDATAFNQPLNTWDVSSVTNMTNMFLNVTLSTENYDDTLIAWDALNLQPNVVFHGGNSLYCNSATQRLNMINSDGWTITDGGQTICGSLSTNEFDEDIVALYPNPARNSFSINSNENIKQIAIHDLSGKEVLRYDRIKRDYRIENLVSGIYFVKIQTEKGEVTKKLIKK
ncbi:BspA family leucine-rich repeat surface protein [Hyunsoonleella rubra]|uniref:BspA family leucine-rich repeat surface protein n=1 Tax=Hyunsoonleella rubra TaxID=1737062 RepID=A0ABW5TF56_9FLAO